MTSIPDRDDGWAALAAGGTGWSVEVDDHRSNDRFAAAIWTGELGQVGHRVVARVTGPMPAWSSTAQERAIAEARLMASAPDLLAALESIASDCERYGHLAGDAWPTAAIALGSAAQHARQVIAKARGKPTQAPRPDWPASVPPDWRLLGCPHTASCVTPSECDRRQAP